MNFFTLKNILSISQYLLEDISLFKSLDYFCLQIMCWRKSYRFWRSTQLSRLVDTYLETLVEQKGVKKISDLKEEEQILHEVYTHSPDMQMLLNLLTEKEGIWASILILSTFDRNFKNEFKVLHT